MKGVTFIIILSVVWSIVSSIIEKKKAAAKKSAASTSNQPTVRTSKSDWTADPVQIKIESLRRRRRAKPEQAPPPVPHKRREHVPIMPLHKEDCPLPPTGFRNRTANVHAKQLASMLRNNRNIRTAIVLSEILKKPVSQR